MPPTKSLEERKAEMKAKAEEMKAKAAAKKAASAGGGAIAPAAPAVEAKFLLGEQNLVLIDWDDTLFPTSAWKDRIQEGAAQPPRASKIQALSEAIGNFIRTLQSFGEVKIVTHGTRGWFATSSSVLLPETKALLDGLEHRYRDSHGEKYMRKGPAGTKYTTDIGVQVDNYGEWFKTDMFFHFISAKKVPRKWDETHLPEKVILPRQVLIIGDGNAEKRSYDEHGNQARIYASRPGHEAVANVGLKGVFLKDGPSFDELLLQMRWATANVGSTFLPAGDASTCMWDLTSFPAWVCSQKVGANAYQPLNRGSLMERAVGAGGAVPMELDEDADLQRALAASLAESSPGGGAVATAAVPAVEGATSATEASVEANADDDEEERAMQEAIALSLS